MGHQVDLATLMHTVNDSRAYLPGSFWSSFPRPLVPAKAGRESSVLNERHWVPAFTGKK